MSDPVTRRRRLTAGLALAVALGVGLCHWVLLRTRAQEASSRNERVAVVYLRALTEVVTRAGGAGDGARRAVASFAAQQPDLATVRVITGVSLEASTAPEDTGEKAAPRRLSRDEKPLYDLGQRLRAAVEVNRGEGAARKGEIEVTATAAGGLSLAEPLEKDGAVVGFAQVETKPLPRAPATGVLLLLAAIVAPAPLFYLLSGLLGGRKLVLAALATVFLLGTVALYGHYAFTTVAADLRATEQAVGAAVTSQIARAGAALSELSLAEAAPLTPAGWDVDVYRQPLGLIGPTGTRRWRSGRARPGRRGGAPAHRGRRLRGARPARARLRRLRHRRAAGRDAAAPPAGVLLRLPRLLRDDPAGVPAVPLRRGALVHRLQPLHRAVPARRHLGGAEELRRHPRRLPHRQAHAGRPRPGTTRTSTGRSASR